MRRILITAAAGYIGTFLRKRWAGHYDLVLTDRMEIEDPGDAETIMGDIRDAAVMMHACEGVDTVIHLAADRSPTADFDSELLPQNIIGTHNVYRAAAESDVRRLVFASSIHAVGAYPPDVQVKWDMPVRPCCEYGASKCYGEALGHYFSDKRGLSVIAVRIGGVHGHEKGNAHGDCSRFDVLVSEQDLTQLITRCVQVTPELRFAIVHGLSDNRVKRLDISHTRELLGYNPQDEVGAEEDTCEVPDLEPVHP